MQEVVAFELNLGACEDIFQVDRRKGSLPDRIHNIEHRAARDQGIPSGETAGHDAAGESFRVQMTLSTAKSRGTYWAPSGPW